ncbi:MAG: hypothetical protein E7256_04680 [Lachnospiraceae bacterium]|nr:hypothetical protein [Lachnospiraceae bacterium]
MKGMGVLVQFEIKKILRKKSTWITLTLLIIFQLVLSCSNYFGSMYVNGEFLETHAEAISIEQKNGRALSGEKIDSKLLLKMQEAYAHIKGQTSEEYLGTDTYNNVVRPYGGIKRTVVSITSEAGLDFLTVREEEFYQARKDVTAMWWEANRLTEGERQYWMNEEEHLLKPFVYQYADAYDNLLEMTGSYIICMLVTFFLAVCISGVFAEEHVKRTDQLILCTKNGRRKLYFAKLIAGGIITFGTTALFVAIVIGCNFAIYGSDGFTAMVQVVCLPWYSGNMTMGQAFLILTGLLFLALILIGILAMVLGELLKSSMAAMAILIAVTFLARIISIPYMFRGLSHAWNFIPINLLKADQGFFDPRLISVFGVFLTNWQFAPFLYLTLGILIVFIGKGAYCKCQVKGR